MSRRRCIDRVVKAKPSALVVIVAGAGCGKSTLLRQLYDQFSENGGECIWIALEERDENAEQFSTLVLNGFARLDPSIASEALEPSNSGAPTNFSNLASAIGKCVGSRQRRVALFLDDFQFAAEGENAKLILALIRHQPKNFHIFIASRVAPKIHLESLTVDNRLIDLTWRDLAFDAGEAAEFFQINNEDGDALRQIEALRQGTEGWAAGLQLALMKNRLVDAAPGALSASAYSSDGARYFKSEIFEALAPDVQTFLVRTSALDRFNECLAAEVAGVSISSARDIFEYLRNHGFFLIALEGEGRWLRYHHLVQEYLSDLRVESQSSGLSAEEIASLWFERSGQIPDAIEYAIRARNFDRASDLVEAFAIELFNKGAAAELAAWIGRIPNKIIVQRPQLLLYLCKIYAHMRQPIEGLRFQYDRCKQVIETLEAVGHFKSEAELRTLLAELEVSEAIIRFRAGDMMGVIDAGATILEINQPIRTSFLASLHNIMGYAYYSLGDLTKARASLTKARDLHLSARSVFGVVFAEAFKGMVSLSDGSTTTAARHFYAGLDHASTELGENSLPASVARLYLTVYRYEVNDPIDETEFDRTLAECRFCCEPEIYANALVTRHRLVHRAGHPDKAREALADALTYAREIGNDLIFLNVGYTALTHELANGSMAEAADIYTNAQSLWANAENAAANVWNRKAFWRDLYRAEMLLATAQPRKAADIYRELARLTARHNRFRRHIHVLAKLSAANAGAGDTEQAIDGMTRALQLAKPARLVRTLLDSAPQTVDLIRLCRAHSTDIELNIFIDKLLGADARRRNANDCDNVSGKRIVLDELTSKEIEVLRILTTGAKNREICERLDISENTVKWHMSRIFQKLGAENRTEAAMIARSVFASL